VRTDAQGVALGERDAGHGSTWQIEARDFHPPRAAARFNTPSDRIEVLKILDGHPDFHQQSIVANKSVCPPRGTSGY